MKISKPKKMQHMAWPYWESWNGSFSWVGRGMCTGLWRWKRREPSLLFLLFFTVYIFLTPELHSSHPADRQHLESESPTTPHTQNIKPDSDPALGGQISEATHRTRSYSTERKVSEIWHHGTPQLYVKQRPTEPITSAQQTTLNGVVL